MRYVVAFFCCAFSASAHAAASVNSSHNFTSADAARTNTYMDIGGVWNGSAEVTATVGDTFRAAFANTGDDAAYELDLGVVLPAGFTYVSNSVSASWSGAGCPLPGGESLHK